MQFVSGTVPNLALVTGSVQQKHCVITHCVPSLPTEHESLYSVTQLLLAVCIVPPCIYAVSNPYLCVGLKAESVHLYVQVLPADVDYRVMLTFLEFYQTLLQFVNFKLYHSLSVHYPPVLDSKLEEAAAGLAAIMQDIAQHQPHKTDPQLTITDKAAAALVTADMQTLPAAVQAGLDASQAAAGADAAAKADTAPGASDEEADEDVGEIDSGDDEEDDAAASDEEDAEGEHTCLQQVTLQQL